MVLISTIARTNGIREILNNKNLFPFALHFDLAERERNIASIRALGTKKYKRLLSGFLLTRKLKFNIDEKESRKRDFDLSFEALFVMLPY